VLQLPIARRRSAPPSVSRSRSSRPKSSCICSSRSS